MNLSAFVDSTASLPQVPNVPFGSSGLANLPMPNLSAGMRQTQEDIQTRTQELKSNYESISIAYKAIKKFIDGTNIEPKRFEPVFIYKELCSEIMNHTKAATKICYLAGLASVNYLLRKDPYVNSRNLAMRQYKTVEDVMKFWNFLGVTDSISPATVLYKRQNIILDIGVRQSGFAMVHNIFAAAFLPDSVVADKNYMRVFFCVVKKALSDFGTQKKRRLDAEDRMPEGERWCFQILPYVVDGNNFPPDYAYNQMSTIGDVPPFAGTTIPVGRTWNMDGGVFLPGVENKARKYVEAEDPEDCANVLTTLPQCSLNLTL